MSSRRLRGHNRVRRGYERRTDHVQTAERNGLSRARRRAVGSVQDPDVHDCRVRDAQPVGDTRCRRALCAGNSQEPVVLAGCDIRPVHLHRDLLGGAGIQRKGGDIDRCHGPAGVKRLHDHGERIRGRADVRKRQHLRGIDAARSGIGIAVRGTRSRRRSRLREIDGRRRGGQVVLERANQVQYSRSSYLRRRHAAVRVLVKFRRAVDDQRPVLRACQPWTLRHQHSQGSSDQRCRKAGAAFQDIGNKGIVLGCVGRNEPVPHGQEIRLHICAGRWPAARIVGDDV